ncbi:MAG: tryptophan synthase subunit alpha [Coriobacteriia bacterium]|nr:tryptophan synthase subunit alpha [Coriobacteriia bacterium]
MGEAPLEDPAAPGASRLTAAFPSGNAALIAYLMAGYPDRATSLEALRAAARAGADIIELGVPYGDPLADGPVIAEASTVAREQQGGFGLAESIALAAEFGATAAGVSAPPVVLMTYLNPLMRFGLARAAEAMRSAGIAGVIVPDMPPEAARPWLAVSQGIDTVFLVAPTSTDERLAVVAGASSGFVYCVSTTGVTGERASMAEGLADLVARVRRHTTLPVAVGFGVSGPLQAAEVACVADGVIVGSAIVRRQRESAEVETFVRQLRAVLRSF